MAEWEVGDNGLTIVAEPNSDGNHCTRSNPSRTIPTVHRPFCKNRPFPTARLSKRAAPSNKNPLPQVLDRVLLGIQWMLLRPK